MTPRVYIETTIPSYLTAGPTRDLIRAGRQQLTVEWWARHRPRFHLVAAQTVIDECSEGDPAAAAARLSVQTGVPLLVATDAVRELTKALIDGVPLPPKASTDDVHVATAAVHGI